MPEQVFNENDSDEMRTLKNQIRNSALDGDVRSYGEENKIVFYAFQGDDIRVLRFFFDERNNDLVAAFYYRVRDDRGQRQQWSRQIRRFPFNRKTALEDIGSELGGFRREKSAWRDYGLDDFRKIEQ